MTFYISKSCWLLPFLCFSLAACVGNVSRSVVFESGSIPISVPAELEVYEIDGEPLRIPSLQNGMYTVSIPSGQHSIAVQYLKNWNEANDGVSSSGRIVRWQPVVFTADFKQRENYTLVLDNPDNYDAAVALKDNPKIYLHSNNKAIAAGSLVHVPQGLGVLLNDSRYRYGIPSTSKPQAKVRPVYNKQVAPQVISTSFDTDKLDSSSGSIEPLQQLKRWWSSATESEKKEFWLWLAPSN